MIRSRLVLPEPDGPRRATSSPVGTVRLTSATATKGPKDFVTERTSMDTWVLRGGYPGLGRAPFHERFGDEGHEGEEGEEGGHRKGGLEVVLVVEDLDVQGQGVRPAADVARHHRHRAELPHRAGVAEDH